MFSKSRLILTSLILCSALIACSENDSDGHVSQTVSAVTQNTKIKVGMSEQAVKDLLGEPSLIQTRTIDELTSTHSEWTNEQGTTSVQFINSNATFNQFIPAETQD